MKVSTNTKATTIRDVANACDVSVATVSFVINGKTNVKPETRQRVWDAVTRLHYRPNALARSLASRQTRIIGVISGTQNRSVFTGSSLLSSPYTAAIVDGIMRECMEMDYNVTLFTKSWQHLDPAAPWWSERQTDGMIVLAPCVDPDILHRLQTMDIPLIGIAPDADRLGIRTVDVDNRMGATYATEHLISLGHRRIAHLAGTLTHLSARTRLDVFTEVMHQHGLEVPEGFAPESSYSGTHAAANAFRLLKSANPPTAIFAADDKIAFEVIKVARDLGVSVPRQLSVIGFDDVPKAMSCRPNMTTIRQPLAEIGSVTAKHLIGLINGDTVPVGSRLLPPTLVLRASTASAPSYRDSATNVR